MFEVVFDYGDHDEKTPLPNDYKAVGPNQAPKFAWEPRRDPFSSYRSDLRSEHSMGCVSEH